jgi:hypothetical protein
MEKTLTKPEKATQAKPTKPEKATQAGKVDVRITRFGHQQVSSGEHIAAQGDVMLDEGSVITVDQETAKVLEARGLAEIQ